MMAAVPTEWASWEICDRRMKTLSLETIHSTQDVTKHIILSVSIVSRRGKTVLD
jgi:hypothetical protein